MAKVINFPKQVGREGAEVAYLRSYLKSNIIELTEIRKKLVRLQQDMQKFRRASIRLVPNGNDDKPKQD